MSASLAALRAASRGSLDTAREQLETVLATGSVDGLPLAEDLTSLADLLDRDVTLRRLFTDPGRPAEAKAGVAGQLLEGKLGTTAIEVFSGLVRSRWSRPRDLVIALEVLSVEVELGVAESDGTLDDVEDELFRFARIVEREPELATALSERTAREARVTLVEGLLRDRVHPTTTRMVTRLVRAPHGRSVLDGLEDLATLATSRRQRVVALVRAAVPLTSAQRERLAAVLRRLYGSAVRLNIEIDDEIIGGLTVRIGDEVIDGSIATKLAEASRQLGS